jgi:flagellum-specific ATP synthase
VTQAVSAVPQALSQSLRNIQLDDVPVAQPTARVHAATGLLLECTGAALPLGARCAIEMPHGGQVSAQVVGFRGAVSFVMPLRAVHGLASGARVTLESERQPTLVGPTWLGRIVNGLAEPVDGKGRLGGEHVLPTRPPQVNPLRKQPVQQAMDVGVRAINGMLTLGRGQRVGLFAGSGVGKSVLLGMMTQHTEADVIIVGLIGERGREVREFIEHALGPDGLRRAIVVVAPADEPALMRMMATELCHTLAAHFRDQGANVLLLVDSLTRYAMARREIALALGEPPATRGYPPSVFGMLPQLVESAGNGERAQGSMTAIYTVLAEGDDQQDPIADTARAILDGHIVLTRSLAERGHYPSIDVAASISRCMPQVVSAEHLAAARQAKEWMSSYAQVRDLIPMGAYVPGADAKTDRAVQQWPLLEKFLRQGTQEASALHDSVSALAQVVV